MRILWMVMKWLAHWLGCQGGSEALMFEGFDSFRGWSTFNFQVIEFPENKVSVLLNSTTKEIFSCRITKKSKQSILRLVSDSLKSIINLN